MHNKNTRYTTHPLIVVALIVLGFVVGRLSITASWAASGTLDPSAPPGSTLSYTLEDIYNRLAAGTVGTQSAFAEPSSGPTTGTGRTLNEIMSIAPAVDNTNGAIPAEVLSGKTYWSLRTDGTWGTRTGTYISSLSSPAPVPKTGQTLCYNESGTEVSCVGTGQDGEHQKGVAWPDPRFTDNGNGTVTDNLTGLIWLKTVNCGGWGDWETALSHANGLASGTCGLTDGSSAGDWRMPNVRELQSLIDYSLNGHALPNGHPFVLTIETYWSSTTASGVIVGAWCVNLADGDLNICDKTATYDVWPVRGGQ